MEMTALIALCIITALLALTLRGQRPEFAMLLSLGCGIFVLLALMGQMKEIITGLEKIMSGLSTSSRDDGEQGHIFFHGPYFHACRGPVAPIA